MRKDFPLFSTVCSVALLSASSGFSQSTDASIAGRIVDEKGVTLPGVTVVVRNEATGFQTTTVTNAEGRYLLRQLPLGKPYTVRASYIGSANQVKNELALNLGDQLAVDFTMQPATVGLQEVVVRGNALNSRIDRLGSSTAITDQTIRQIPVLNRSFANLAALAPTSNGGSVGGQLPSSTNYLIDGVSARNNLTSGAVGNGPYSLSLEAIREFEVATNVYDVTQGRQGGGTISAVTKSGTNTLTGSIFDYYRADFLASPYDIRGNRRTQNFTTNQYGFSLGGPIIKDKLHFFTALDRQDQSAPFFIADIKSDADANALGISRGALDTVLTIARTKYGLSSAAQTGEFGRRTVNNTFFARLDWQINERNRLTLRNNYSDYDNPNSTDDNSAINLYEVYGNFKSRENSTLASLRTQFSPNLLNELKVQYQTVRRDYTPNDQLPAANIPRAIVTVRSRLPNGRQGSTSVQLGGQRFTPENNLENQIQLVNTTYLTKGRYNFTFGTDNTLTYLDTYISSEQNGRFVFNSVQEFDNLNPTRYAREVPLQGVPSVQQYVLNTSLFGQAQYTPLPNVEAIVGVRWDMTSYLTAGAYNPVLNETLGLRTDNNPTDWNNIQPRVQLTWDVKGERKSIVRLGAGIFSANPVNYAQVNNIQNSGTQVASIDVTRPATGENPVPRPDFPAYRADPSSAPGLLPGVPYVSTINLNDKDLQVPNIYKANLSVNRIVKSWLRVGLNLVYSYTRDNYVYLDRNLADRPYFTLDNEANRGVFVPANTITSAGITNNVLGRKTQAVGRTLEFTNGAKVQQAALIVDAEVRYFRDGYFNTSYTLNDTRDNTSYNGNVANTSTFRPIKSDPRSLSEINYSDNQFRHKVVFFGSSPTVKGFALSARFTGLGGSRYSLLTDADINGDFVGGPGTDNDLAFVFDPNNPETDPAVAASMQKVLDNPDNRAKDYIRRSLGGIADRNGGINPFSGTFDVRLQKTFKLFKTQGLTFSVDAFNFANLLNKDWGVNYNLGNQSLLTVSGFNQTTRRYTYRVNENVGTTNQNGTPYQLQLGARYSF
ncbi:carboxypeptidase regulatory-like domain-containing protein [Hymenobacter tibetensis]|uniref:Carboxypeptidase regulatory-like domain-containing protein n=1 Tax=Hymenobacter tibetensis TaxID=497967 RepID=A0ABY4CXC9_9BACT|nr:carboxypeptidase regulatory-like domain-containing protein [Hymenobacter tibetensis]UOG74930.1 carboxypeptidase regulatory-like domain-containing protein [Hymenobacter tibetensis]